MNIKEVLPTKTDAQKLDAQVKKLLLKRPYTLVELANKLNLAPRFIEESASRLKEKKHNISLEADSVSIEREPRPQERLVVNSRDFVTDGEWRKFGALGDTHLASKYSRLDVLRCAYKIYADEGITTVYHTGNIVDGECRFNKHDLLTRSGMAAQIEYLINEYPQSKGITTYFVVGDDHEGWWTQREGIDVGAYIQAEAEKAGRTDLVYIGYLERDIELKAKRGSAAMRIMHSGGGAAYAISYTTQKIVESLQGGEKPRILYVGHHHKFEHGYPREVHTIQTGTTEDQTPFMRKNKIQAHVGFTINKFHQADTGEINRFAVEFVPFYDREFYFNGDKYRRW